MSGETARELARYFTTICCHPSLKAGMPHVWKNLDDELTRKIAERDAATRRDARRELANWLSLQRSDALIDAVAKAIPTATPNHVWANAAIAAVAEYLDRED